jgi:hypothetical protein
VSEDREPATGVPGADKLGGDNPGGDEQGADVGSDLGPGAPPERTPLPEPDEPFQSPMSVAGIGPGGEPYGGRSPSEQNPAADPNEGP